MMAEYIRRRSQAKAKFSGVLVGLHSVSAAFLPVLAVNTACLARKLTW